MRKFKDCYIAFLDVLGFKELLKSQEENLCEKIAKCFDEIQEQYNITVNKTGEYLIEPLSVKQKVMSDSICFYVEASVPNALAGLIATCDYFQVRMLRQNPPTLTRGAIARGELYAEKDVLFGKGFVKAYLMEENTARNPRIIITKQLIKQSSTLNNHGKDYIRRFTFTDEDDFVVLDYLYIFYGLCHEHEDWKNFATHVYEKLDYETDVSIRNKYQYLRKNIERVRKKFIDNGDFNNA